VGGGGGGGGGGGPGSLSNLGKFLPRKGGSRAEEEGGEKQK
jgi:hypothetical protein